MRSYLKHITILALEDRIDITAQDTESLREVSSHGEAPTYL